tara:strand:+ start:2739 stop:3611 length:873 start_codon:yes stop_codon:yes gene_type:complete
MAETLTFDNTTEQTSADSLTTEEQDSLQVGEQIQEQESELLAGKYENAQQLEKAYIELQKKMGGDSSEGEPQSTDNKTEATEEVQRYLEDGTVDYSSVNELYGEQLGEIFKNSNVDPWAISQHFHENRGSITDSMYSQLEGAGLSRASIDSYLAGRAVESGYTSTQPVAEITDAQVDTIQNSVGGEASYNQLLDWATDNISADQLNSFDNLVVKGDVDSIQLALNGIKAAYDNSQGYEGRMLSGKAPRTSGDVFRSQAEVVKAMSHPDYDNDPAYRQDIIDKLARSDVQF